MKVEPLTKIWLEFNGNKFMLPVNPKKIDTKKKSKPDEHDIVGKGQIAVPQYPDLKTYKWESFFPGDADDPYTAEEALEIPDYIEILDTAMNDARIGYLTINRPSGQNEHKRVIITAFDYQDVGGEPLDITYTIELEEWKSYKAEKIVIKKKKKKKKTVATKEKKRPITKKKVRVGAKVVANGKYWYSSYGAKPYGTAKNLQTEVKRIVKGNKYPICIGHYGWVKESQLQVKE
jgi:hypothetical protein